VWYLAALLLLSITTATPDDVAADVTAATLDGSSIAGRLESWANGKVVLATVGGHRQLPEAELLSLRRPADEAAPTASDLAPAVELVDGTMLPITGYRHSGDRATVVLDRPTAVGEPTVAVAARQIAAVRLQPLGADLARQWDEIRTLGLPGDVLVVLKRDGQSLDYVEGIIGNVSAKDVQFTMDGQSVRIELAKVAGLVYYRSAELAAGRTDRQPDDQPDCVLVGGNALRINASRVRLDDGLLNVTTSDGVKLTWPWDDFSMADFSAGKLVYLSDLEPAAQQWAPLVGLPAAASLASDYGRPRRDQSAFGGPLAIRFPPDETADSAGHEETYGKGLALRSRTQVEYRLPRGFRRFVAVAGIEPSASVSGNVRLTIQGDGRPLMETVVAGDSPPLPIELDVAGVKRLAITVDYGENLDTGDWLNLCQARIVK
jgi:hypothetical protein